MSPASDTRPPVAATMEALNRAWLNGDLTELRLHFHPEIAMALPGFGATVVGINAVLEGFDDMVRTAKVVSFDTGEMHVHVVEPAAVVSFPFDMIYEREQMRFHSTGRDLWIFVHDQGRWKAIWRTMLDLKDEQVNPDRNPA